MTAGAARPIALLGARLIDPAAGYDGPGAVLIRDGVIAEVSRGPGSPLPAAEVEIIEANGALLCPGLVDLRVKAAEPGEEAIESLESIARAAAAGGVTTLVLQPETHPAIDEPALAASIIARSAAVGLVTVLPSAAGSRGLAGESLGELGLLREAGCVLVSNGETPIADSRMMRRLLVYAERFGLAVAHRPCDPWLGRGSVATESELAGRLGLPSEPVAAEAIGLRRDLALASLSGGRLLVDQITAAEPLAALTAAKSEGVKAAASASIHHLIFNEVDIGEYCTDFRLTPPLRAEADRQALVEALRSGLLDIVVSAHAPVAPELKRLPFEEAAPGSLGLETLLAGLIGLHRQEGIPLLRLVEAASLAPARLIGSPAGRLAAGAPADLILCDLDAPWIVDPARFVSIARNCASAGRRVQGRVRLTIASGKIAWRDEGAPTPS